MWPWVSVYEIPVAVGNSIYQGGSLHLLIYISVERFPLLHANIKLKLLKYRIKKQCNALHKVWSRVEKKIRRVQLGDATISGASPGGGGGIAVFFFCFVKC